MKIDKRTYTGGMDRDTDPHMVKGGDYRYALNCIVGNDETGNLGSISNVKGTTIVDFTIPDGVNKCIGSYNDSKNSRIFFFLYNSVGNHSIFEYNTKSESVSSLIISKVLNFDWQQLINDVNVVDDNLLYFTDGWNPPRKINIDKAKKTQEIGGYSGRINNGVANTNIPELQDTLLDNPVMVIEEYFDAIKYGPYKEPTVQYFNDFTDTTTTKVDKSGFQFKYKWIYDDGEQSVYSPISKVSLQNDKAAFFGSLTSIFSVSGSSGSATASGTTSIQPIYDKWSPEGNYWYDIERIYFDSQYEKNEFDDHGIIFSLETGESINQVPGSPFANNSALSEIESTTNIIPSGGGEVDGAGSYNPNTGVYTAPLDGVYNIDMSVIAEALDVLDDDGNDVTNAGVLNGFKPASVATSLLLTEDKPYKYIFSPSFSFEGDTPNTNQINLSGTGWSADDTPVFSDWTEVDLENDITYIDLGDDGVTALNHNFNPAAWVAVAGTNNYEWTNYRKNLTKGFWGDNFSSVSGTKAKWNKDEYKKGSTNRSVAYATNTSLSSQAPSYSTAGTLDNPGIIEFSNWGVPPMILQRVTFYTDHEPTGDYSIEDTKNNTGAFNTELFLGSMFQQNKNETHKIGYLKYDSEKQIDANEVSKVKFFLVHQQYQGGTQEYAMNQTGATNELVGTDISATTFSYSDSEFALEQGDKIFIIAKRTAHVYNCFTDLETQYVYKEKVGIGANITDVSYNIEYDNTLSNNFTPTSSQYKNSKKNAVRVTVQTGSELVKKISVAVRDMEIGVNPEFYKLLEIDKEELGLQDFHTYDLVFKNDKTIKDVIDVAESNRMYDFLPRIARSQEYLNNNRIAYANILEGYNPLPKSGSSPEKLSVNLLMDLMPQVSGLSFKAFPSMYENLTGMEAGLNNFTHLGNKAYTNFGASKGDTLTPNYTLSGGSNNSSIGVRIIQDGQENLTIPAASSDNESFNDFYWGDADVYGGWAYDRNGIINPDTPGLKRGGRYTYGLVYYDRAGRASMVNSYSNPESPSTMVLDVPWYDKLPTEIGGELSPNYVNSIDEVLQTTTVGNDGSGLTDSYLNWRTLLSPNIIWEINHTPPKWATHYQWVMTKNENTDYFIQGVTGGPVDSDQALVEHFLFYKSEGGEGEVGRPFSEQAIRTNPGSIKYMDINVEHFMNYDKYYGNGKDEPVISYSHLKGDKIRFIGWKQGVSYYTSATDFWWRNTGTANSVQVDAGNPNNNTYYWGHGLYQKYIEFEINDIIEIDGQSYLRVTGDFSIFNETLYYKGPGIDGVVVPHQSNQHQPTQSGSTIPADTYAALLKNSMFEIYRTKDEIAPSDKIFYEFGQTFRIGNPHSDDRFHMGDLNDQDLNTERTDGTTVPARGAFGAKFSIINHPVPVNNANGENRRCIGMTTRSYGDTYTRNRVHIIDDSNCANVPTLNGTTLTSIDYNETGDTLVKYLIDESYVQDYHINDTVSKFQITTGMGRPHLQNDEIGEEWRYSTVRFSDPLIEDTNQNQLNTFYESKNPSLGITSGFIDYEKDYGSIQKIISRDTDLIILHENKSTKALVSKDINTRADGSGDLVVTANPLSPAVPFVGEFGVGLNPESVAKFNNVIYFADLRNGAILRLSRDGITRISENGMHKYFKDISRELTSINGAIVNVYGEYNTDYNEYIVTFDSALESNFTTPSANVFLDYNTPKLRSLISKNLKS
tara:strand:- start:15396 stop:20519 length:5124 start_codon:yes stop_codon:yes gene_type:complete